ncbi:MAG: hypothetical protein GX774_01705 [Armatimonadetes bacterium]|jgi:hypothetical protein|nr:hypothetical protein [Armatimonadota bacterium]
MTPIDEAVGIFRGLASQVGDVEPHCVELRTDPEEGTILSLEYLCGDLALWVQLPVEDDGQIDETGRAWVSAQLEPISLPQPLGIGRLFTLSQQLRQLWPSLHPDVSVRNRGDEECVAEAEWYGEIEPAQGDRNLVATITALLREMRAAAMGLERALLEAEHMQEVEERVAGLLLGAEHASPRKRPPGSGRRRWGQRR